MSYLAFISNGYSPALAPERLYFWNRIQSMRKTFSQQKKRTKFAVLHVTPKLCNNNDRVMKSVNQIK